jgi:hypothetical protein
MVNLNDAISLNNMSNFLFGHSHGYMIVLLFFIHAGVNFVYPIVDLDPVAENGS